MQKRSADPKQNRDMEEGKAVDAVDNGDHFTVKADRSQIISLMR